MIGGRGDHVGGEPCADSRNNQKIGSTGWLVAGLSVEGWVGPREIKIKYFYWTIICRVLSRCQVLFWRGCQDFKSWSYHLLAVYLRELI